MIPPFRSGWNGPPQTYCDESPVPGRLRGRSPMLGGALLCMDGRDDCPSLPLSVRTSPIRLSRSWVTVAASLHEMERDSCCPSRAIFKDPDDVHLTLLDFLEASRAAPSCSMPICSRIASSRRRSRHASLQLAARPQLVLDHPHEPGRLAQGDDLPLPVHRESLDPCAEQGETCEVGGCTIKSTARRTMVDRSALTKTPWISSDIIALLRGVGVA